MEMGIVMALCAVFCGLCALCCVACLVVMLANCKVEGEGTPSVTAEAVPPPSGREAKAAPDDVEKRRRQAVMAREHQNFMDYDGTPQQKIDPALILGE